MTVMAHHCVINGARQFPLEVMLDGGADHGVGTHVTEDDQDEEEADRSLNSNMSSPIGLSQRIHPFSQNL